MAESFLGNMLSGGARKPVDMNDPTWTPPESIKQRQTLADQLTGRATQPFAPHWAGALAAGLTGIHGGLERISADQALKSNVAMEKKANEAAAMAPDNIAAGRAYAMSGVPSLGMKGVEHVIAERNDTEKKAIEMHKAESERMKARAALEGIDQIGESPLTGERYYRRGALAGHTVTGGAASSVPPSIQPIVSDVIPNAVVLNDWRKHEAPKLIKESGTTQMEAVQTGRSLADLQSLQKYTVTGWGAEAATTLAKMASSVGLKPADFVSANELFRALTQKFVLVEAQKLKPVSQTDVPFVEKGLPTLQTDPTSIPKMIPVLVREAARNKEAAKLRQNAAYAGFPPDEMKIEALVNAKYPSLIREMFGHLDKNDGGATTLQPTSQPGVKATPPSGPQVKGKSQARLSAQGPSEVDPGFAQAWAALPSGATWFDKSGQERRKP